MTRYNLLPLAFFAAGLLLVLTLSQAEINAQRDRLTLETRITGEQVKLRLESCLSTREALVRTIAARKWGDSEKIISQWTPSVSPVVALYPGVQALNYIDPDWYIRVVVPATTNAAALDQNLRSNRNQSVIAALTEAERTSQLTRTSVINLLQGGNGITLYLKIRSEDGRAIGFVNGVFRIADLLNACMADTSLAQRFRWALRESDNSVFYHRAETSDPDNWPLASRFAIPFAGKRWQLDYAPTRTYYAASTESRSAGAMALGLGLIALLSWAFRMLLINQKHLEESEDKYRLLVENQSDLVIQIDMDQNFTYVSPSFCRTFGKTEADWIGQPFWPVVHEEDLELIANVWQRATQPPFRSYHEGRNLTAEGVRWMSWTTTAVLDAKGEVILVNAAGRDVTDIRKMEESISQAQKMQAIGEMAGGITHDFNNLLQVMLSNIEFLMASAGDREKAALEQVQHVVERGMGLTAQLSTLSRQQTINKSVVNLVPFLDECRDLLARTLPPGIQLQLSLPDSPAYVVADNVQIEQVLLNLCFNARDAMEKQGNLRISLYLESLDDGFCQPYPELIPGEYARISVRDDGKGIPASDLPRIFDPFFTTKGDENGTGLGLANCDSIIRQHNGIILVSSDVGRGTNFDVYLPASNQQEELEVNRATHGDRLQGEGLILVVDDDEAIVQLTSRMLEQAGFEVITAANGHDALVIYEEHQDDIRLVILDVVMPIMDGIEAAARIRETSPTVPIIFASGYVPASPLAESSIERLLSKPFKNAELLAMVDEALGGEGNVAT